MRINLTAEDRADLPSHEYLHSKTLAWRALGMAMGVAVEDPRHVIDGGGVLTEYTTGMHFALEQAGNEGYIRAEETNMWDGSRRSLFPHITYVSYSVAPDQAFFEFHGWYRPRGKSRPLGKKAGDPCAYMSKAELYRMDALLETVQRRLIRVAPS